MAPQVDDALPDACPAPARPVNAAQAKPVHPWRAAGIGERRGGIPGRGDVAMARCALHSAGGRGYSAASRWGVSGASG